MLLYNYRGDPTSIRRDGSMEPYQGVEGQSGKEYILQPGVRRRDSEELEKDLEAVEGQVYYVSMTQLIFENGALTPGEPGKIVDPHNPGESYDSADDFPEAVVAFSADFYALKSNNFKYINQLKFNDANGDGRPDILGLPLFSRNLAVRR